MKYREGATIRRVKKIILYYAPAMIKAWIAYMVPVLYGALEIRPDSCSVMITNRCNLRCIMCKQWRTPAVEELSARQWFKAIDDMAAVGIKNIHFTGGEPLLREDIEEIIRYACGKAMATGITTNGILLTPERLSRLVAAGLRSVALSIDAIGDAYSDIRGVDRSFEKVKAAAESLSAMKMSGKIDAYINFTVMKDSLGHVGEVKRFADSMHIPMAICLLDKSSSIFDIEKTRNDLWIRGGDELCRLKGMVDFLKKEKVSDEKSLVTSHSGLDYIERYFADPVQRRVPCISSQTRIYAGPGGELMSGCLSMGTFGNIAQTPLATLLEDHKYRAAKKRMFYKECDGCSCGYFLNLQLFLPTAIKEAGYNMSSRFKTTPESGHDQG